MAAPECVAQTPSKLLPYLTGQCPHPRHQLENLPTSPRTPESLINKDLNSEMPSCIVVSISGGQAAGKKAVQAAITRRLKELSNGQLRITCLHMGDFIRFAELDRELLKQGHKDMDSISAYDLEWLVSTMTQIRNGEKDIKIPSFNYVTLEHEHELALNPKSDLGEEGPTDVLIVEGCYMLCEKRLVEMADIKLFVDLGADERLGRRGMNQS
jgi:uridine kinase